MTNKTAWTPGPWRVVDPDSGGWCVQSARMTSDAKNGGFVSAVCPGPDGQANAQLIALAPEMAEALRLVRADLAHYVSTHGPGPDARLALVDSILSRLPVAK